MASVITVLLSLILMRGVVDISCTVNIGCDKIIIDTTSVVEVNGHSPIHDGMAEVTACIWMKTDGRPDDNQGAPISYAIPFGNSNEFTLYQPSNLLVYVKKTRFETKYGVNDNTWHHVCVTWQSTDGELRVYDNGIKVNETSNIEKGETIQGCGAMTLGQEQDTRIRFDVDQKLVGELTLFNMWSRVLSEAEILQIKEDTLGDIEGDIFSWKSDFLDFTGNVTILPNNIVSDHQCLEEQCKRYVVHTHEVKWSSAKSSCESNGGKLAMLNTLDIYDKVRSFIFDNGIDGRVKKGFWFGLARDNSGKFTWSDGSVLLAGNFTEWARREPNNNHKKDPINGQECAQLWKKHELEWDDDYCGENKTGDRRKKGYICEHDIIGCHLLPTYMPTCP